MSSRMLRGAFAALFCLALSGALPIAVGAQAQPATTPAPATSAAAPAPAAAAPSTPATATDPSQATGAAATATTASAPPTEATPSAAAEPSATKPAKARWTDADVARVRAMLEAARSPRPTATPVIHDPPKPRKVVYGDAGAPFALGVSVDSVFNDDPGYDLFAENDVATRLGLFAGYDVVSLCRDLILAAELGVGREAESQSGLLGGTLDTELTTTSFFGAASVRYVLLPWLQPHARLAGGGSLVRMTLTSSDEEDDTANTATPFVSLGAGALLRTPTRLFEGYDGRFASLSLGLLLEGGYTLAGDVKLSMKSQRPDTVDIAVQQPTLGTLSMGGPYVRTSLVLRF